MIEKHIVLLIIALDVNEQDEVHEARKKISLLDLPFAIGHSHIAINEMATKILALLESKVIDETYHDEETLFKVYKALQEVGLDLEKATDAVSNLQNHGILFRERIPEC